jgi:hypothetical protein
MSEMSEKIISELKNISEDVQKTFGELSPEQINWKPSSEGWSVGQCLEHLIKTNELFYVELDQIADGNRKSSLLESYSPLSGFFGGLLIKSLKKDERKFKAPSPKIVPPSEIDPNIVEVFQAHQSELIEKITAIESEDFSKIKVTSPFLKIATYRLSDGFQIIIEHEKRHFRQAKRVKSVENFPK